MQLDDLLTQKSILNPKIWRDNMLDSSVKQKLLAIGHDFFDNLGLDGVEVEDFTFTGSLANYNYTKYSDVDLHLLVDFEKIDENLDLVKEYFRARASLWNQKHKILIKGYEVEIYVQDIDEEHHSTGVYSIKKDKWIANPWKAGQKIPKYDKSVVEKKIKAFIGQIEDAEKLFDDKKFKKSHDFAEKMIDKLKNFRQSGLERDGEYSNENLVFKTLRNHEYIKTLYDIRTDSYDRLMSLDGNYQKKFKIFVSQKDQDVKKGFNKLEEMELYQKKVYDKHPRLKFANISKGKQNPGAPYLIKPSKKRGPSAPPIGESYNA